ncbi:GntR family transcriptional regulator [Methylobacterium sp. J-030]|uniref:GntR family transcriptional regulator n=1 Tax=Methylobacterium sp. J-030 TaxID=2836627 RepID=UPI001FB8A236|nr:GntR family transcriptional regulator [Methylobacterium sp. J-030]MCJ2067638.1 GntR family transcriptional regulator [Methylobacterium sp. J-030]
MSRSDTVMLEPLAHNVGAQAGRAAPAAIAEQLRRDILHGLAAGGTRMRQDAVASRFGVSQNTAREAFRQLEAEGFLRSEPRRGVSVVPLTAGEAREITELRVLLEVQALEWAIEAFDAAKLKQAEVILAQLDQAHTVDDIISLNGAFHRTLYDAASRERALGLIEMLRLNFERYLRLTWQETAHLKRSQQQHRELLMFFLQKDRVRASSLLREHIWDTGQLLIERLNNASRE